MLKNLGGVFGRNPTFNNVTAKNLSLTGSLIINGETITGLDYNGTWNASTNTPTLASGIGTAGALYIVSVAGTTTLDGVSNWGVGDFVLFNGTTWQRVEGGADGNFVNLSASGTTTLGPATANLEASGTTIAAKGTDTNIDININAKGSGVAYLNQRWGVNQSGALVASAGNTYDIGNGTNNPRDVNIDRYAVMNGLTASKAVFTDGNKNLSTTGTVGTTQGGTGLTSFTANGVVYASSTSALTTGSALTFSGTSLVCSVNNATGYVLDFTNSGGYCAQFTCAQSIHYPLVCVNSANTGDNKLIGFGVGGGTFPDGSITYNRGAGQVAYNITSDYRAKNILGPVTDSGATIDALKVYLGKIKGASMAHPMLIAHEAQLVTPYAVTGEKDAVAEDGTPEYQQINLQIFVPLLIAEIQSLRSRVAQLENKT